MTAPTSWFDVSHVHLMAWYTCAKYLVDYVGPGGSMENDPFLPDVVPASCSVFEDLGDLAEVLPANGGVYGTPIGPDETRPLPWVEVTVTTSDEFARSDSESRFAEVTIAVRARLGMSTNTATGRSVSNARMRAENGARMLARAGALAIGDRMCRIARDFNADAFGISSVIDVQPPNSSQTGAGASPTNLYFDAEAFVTVVQNTYVPSENAYA